MANTKINAYMKHERTISQMMELPSNNSNLSTCISYLYQFLIQIKASKSISSNCGISLNSTISSLIDTWGRRCVNHHTCTRNYHSKPAAMNMKMTEKVA